MFYRGWSRTNSTKITDCFDDGHWETFQELRKKHNENICFETNKLVLILDQLINSNEDERKQSPERIVQWTSDSLVKLCPFCARSFSIAYRRHHCRTCGAILCKNCSKFLNYEEACKLVKPAKLYKDQYDRIEDRLQSAKDAEEKIDIRTCEDCKRLLDKRIQSIKDYYCQPSLCDFYEKLRKKMSEADELILSQSSLRSENKQTRPELKVKIQDLKDLVASMSGKLMKMAQGETGKQAHLLEAINQSILYWLKESEEAKLNRNFGSRAKTSSGWVPEQPACSAQISGDVNPLLIQIKNLEEYIKQARLDNKYEEVIALEENKRDLEIEYCIEGFDIKEKE